jgi:hypothetical protein
LRRCSGSRRGWRSPCRYRETALFSHTRYAFADEIWNKLTRFPRPLRRATAGLATVPSPSFYDRIDLMSYLPDDILVKVDRAAMAVNLETRVPMLDHRLVEFVMSLPLGILRAEGQPKWPLRQLLFKYVPKDLVERLKMGFRRAE